jgi:hypothetical protein
MTLTVQRSKQMTHYAILDTNAGLLQWIGRAGSTDEAFSKFAADVGEDADRDSLVFHSIDAKEAKLVSKWWADGGHSNDTPEFIR